MTEATPDIPLRFCWRLRRPIAPRTQCCALRTLLRTVLRLYVVALDERPRRTTAPRRGWQSDVHHHRHAAIWCTAYCTWHYTVICMYVIESFIAELRFCMFARARARARATCPTWAYRVRTLLSPGNQRPEFAGTFVPTENSGLTPAEELDDLSAPLAAFYTPGKPLLRARATPERRGVGTTHVRARACACRCLYVGTQPSSKTQPGTKTSKKVRSHDKATKLAFVQKGPGGYFTGSTNFFWGKAPSSRKTAKNGPRKKLAREANFGRPYKSMLFSHHPVVVRRKIIKMVST